MKVEIHKLEKESIGKFADRHELVIEVRERDKSFWPARYYASFKRTEIKNGAMLTGVYGNGSTPSKAIRDYAERISRRLIVVDAMSENRREIWVPVLTAR